MVAVIGGTDDLIEELEHVLLSGTRHVGNLVDLLMELGGWAGLGLAKRLDAEQLIDRNPKDRGGLLHDFRRWVLGPTLVVIDGFLRRGDQFGELSL